MFSERTILEIFAVTGVGASVMSMRQSAYTPFSAATLMYPLPTAFFVM